jgi:hypothetical protein
VVVKSAECYFDARLESTGGRLVDERAVEWVVWIVERRDSVRAVKRAAKTVGCGGNIGWAVAVREGHGVACHVGCLLIYGVGCLLGRALGWKVGGWLVG